MRGPLLLSSRLLLAALILLPSISLLDQMNAGVWTLKDLGIPYAWIVAPGLALTELVLGFCIAIGFQLRLAIPALVLFSLLNGTIFRELLLHDETLLQAKTMISSWLASSVDALQIVSFNKS